MLRRLAWQLHRLIPQAPTQPVSRQAEILRLRHEIQQLSEQELRTQLHTTKHKLIDDLTVDPTKLTRIYASQVQRRHSEYVEKLHAEVERTYAEEQRRLHDSKQQAWLQALNATQEDVERLGELQEQMDAADAAAASAASAEAAPAAKEISNDTALPSQTTAAPSVSPVQPKQTHSALAAMQSIVDAALAPVTSSSSSLSTSAATPTPSLSKPISLIGRTNKTKNVVSKATSTPPSTVSSDKAADAPSVSVLPFSTTAATSELNERGQRVRVVGGLFGGIMVEDDADASAEVKPAPEQRPLRSMDTASFITAMKEAQAYKAAGASADKHAATTMPTLPSSTAQTTPPQPNSTTAPTATTSPQFTNPRAANHQQMRGSVSGFAMPASNSHANAIDSIAAKTASSDASPATEKPPMPATPTPAFAPTSATQTTSTLSAAAKPARSSTTPPVASSSSATPTKYTYSWATGRPVRVAIIDQSEETSGVRFLDTDRSYIRHTAANAAKKPPTSAATSSSRPTPTSANGPPNPAAPRLLATPARTSVATSTIWYEDKRSTLTHYGQHTSSYSIEFTTSRYFRR